jgi:hypothetical protein
MSARNIRHGVTSGILAVLIIKDLVDYFRDGKGDFYATIGLIAIMILHLWSSVPGNKKSN